MNTDCFIHGSSWEYFSVTSTTFTLVYKRIRVSERPKWRLILTLFLLVGKYSQKLFFPTNLAASVSLQSLYHPHFTFLLYIWGQTTRNTQREGTGRKLARTLRKSHFIPGLFVCDHIIYHLNTKIWEIILHTINK